MAEEFLITIARKYRGDACTSGYLAVNGKVICHSLERPYGGNAPVISAIPVGRYKDMLRYDHAKRWRIELIGVPGRDFIQIHTGNTPANTEGCILVGTGLGADMCSVTGSKAAHDALRTAFYGSASPAATPDKNIVVSVED
jgi:hypothetical protein